jgi:hypothetical protein
MVVIDYDNTGIEVDFCTECKGVWLDRWEFEIIFAALTEEFLKNTQFFRSEGSPSDAFRLAVYVWLAAIPLSGLLSGVVDGFPGFPELVVGFFILVFILVFFSYPIASGTYNAIQVKGTDLGGLWVKSDGIVDRSSWGRFCRVHWPEIKVIYPANKTFFGVPMGRQFIGLEVTDSYLQRKPTWIRFRIWMNRKVFKAPDLRFSTRRLRDSRERILLALQDGLRQYELRSISEAKELEGGS